VATDWLVLDTALLLAGKEPPRGRWATTPEASMEVQPGGRDARRFAYWQEIGLQVRAATPDSEDRVDQAAMAAGSLGRLSVADRSLLALCLDLGGTLVTDDHTMLDVAQRLRLPTQTISSDGIEGTMDWKPRCAGCGRWFDEMPKREECPVCGTDVHLKPWQPPST
jgi:UPF0271 protein